MPEMAEAMTEKEPIDEQANGQSFPRFRLSGSAGAPVPFPLFGPAQLLILPSSLSVPLPCARNRVKRFPLG
jgi:hypothetical protein